MKLCIYCAGGLGKEIFDIALRINLKESRWDQILFIDDDSSLGNSIYLGQLYTMDNLLKEFNSNDCEIIIATGEPSLRKKLYTKVKGLNLKFTTLIDPSCIISNTSDIGEGVIVATNSFISSDVKLSDNVLINASTIIGHDIKIGENTAVSSFVSIGGATEIGQESYIGMGAIVKEQVEIGSNVIIGMGSVVHINIPDQVIAMGNPARIIRRNEDNKVFSKKSKDNNIK